MNGIFLLDKPLNISSNHALQKAKRLFKAKKAGHTGTLDPMASGMLPICFGEATKFSNYLLDSDKTYSVTMQLGVRTNTSDAEGEIISTRDVPSFSLSDIDTAFSSFRGDIMQIPTMFSALKFEGRKLYEYAREGITIERAARPITIYAIDVLSLENNFVKLTVKCSKGTYIRTLVDDVGEKLQCGAHVTHLRRLSVGPFQENQMMTFEKLELIMHSDNFSPEKILLPVDIAVTHLPKIIFSRDEVIALLHGKTLHQLAHHSVGLVRFYDDRDQFFGVGEIKSDGEIVSRRLISHV